MSASCVWLQVSKHCLESGTAAASPTGISPWQLRHHACTPEEDLHIYQQLPEPAASMNTGRAPVVAIDGPQVGGRPASDGGREALPSQLVLQVASGGQGQRHALKSLDQIAWVVLAV